MIDEASAEELVVSFLAKFNERVQMLPEHWESHIDKTTYPFGLDPNDHRLYIEIACTSRWRTTRPTTTASPPTTGTSTSLSVASAPMASMARMSSRTSS